VLARYRRDLGEHVRFQAGTDDNSLKNVLAAQAAGIGVQEFVDANAAAFIGLAEPLSLSVDDLIRTSSDPRHRAGVERLWRACAARGDLYRRHYEGLYCVGCEQFYPTAELRPRGAGRRACHAAVRLPGGRRAPGAVPPRRGEPHRPPVHPGRDRAPSASGPAAAEDLRGPASSPAAPGSRRRRRRRRRPAGRRRSQRETPRSRLPPRGARAAAGDARRPRRG
jgi:tRNA synthetases class I (M)